MLRAVVCSLEKRKKNDVDAAVPRCIARKDGMRQFHLSSSAAEGNERKKRRGKGGDLSSVGDTRPRTSTLHFTVQHRECLCSFVGNISAFCETAQSVA